MRKALAEVAGDDTLNPLIDLLHPPLRAHAQPGSGQQAKAERRQETERKGLAHDARYFAGLVDVPPQHEDIAVFQTPAYRPNQRIATADRHYPRGLCRSVDREVPRQLSEIAGKPIAGRIEQSRILNASGILAKVVRDCSGAALARQRCHEIELLSDHAIGSGNQVAVDLPVDEAEQHDHEQGENSGNRRGPAEGVRAYELELAHRSRRLVFVSHSIARQRRWQRLLLRSQNKPGAPDI